MTLKTNPNPSYSTSISDADKKANRANPKDRIKEILTRVRNVTIDGKVHYFVKDIEEIGGGALVKDINPDQFKKISVVHEGNSQVRRLISASLLPTVSLVKTEAAKTEKKIEPKKVEAKKEEVKKTTAQVSKSAVASLTKNEPKVEKKSELTPEELNIADRVYNILSNVTNCKLTEITFTSKLGEDLDASVTDLLEIVTDLEEAYAISIDDGEFEDTLTVHDVLKLVVKKITAQNLPTNFPPEVQTLALDPLKKVQAIKALREANPGMRLDVAKAEVEAFIRNATTPGVAPAKLPPLPPTPSKKLPDNAAGIAHIQIDGVPVGIAVSVTSEEKNSLNATDEPKSMDELRAFLNPLSLSASEAKIQFISDLCLAYTKDILEKTQLTKANLKETGRYAYREPRRLLYSEFERAYANNPVVKKFIADRANMEKNTENDSYIRDAQKAGLIDKLHMTAMVLFESYIAKI